MYTLSYLISQYSCDVEPLMNFVEKTVIRKPCESCSNQFDFHGLTILITFPVMQLLYPHLIELCYTDLRQYV